MTSILIRNEVTLLLSVNFGSHNESLLAQDTSYRDTAAEHRGAFLETTIYKLLARVFERKTSFRMLRSEKIRQRLQPKLTFLLYSANSF